MVIGEEWIGELPDSRKTGVRQKPVTQEGQELGSPPTTQGGQELGNPPAVPGLISQTSVDTECGSYKPGHGKSLLERCSRFFHITV